MNQSYIDSEIYNSHALVNLDPILDKKEILKIADLEWHYTTAPLHYYNNNKELVMSDSKQLLIDRNGVQEAIAVRGKDFKVTTFEQLYSVFLKLHNDLGVTLHAAGHTRGGKFIYLVAGLNKEYSAINQLDFKKCLLIYTVNDGNGKTRFTPIMLKQNETEYQVTIFGNNQDKVDNSIVNHCYELSHHFDFDSFEASSAVMESIDTRFKEFEDKFALFQQIDCEESDVDEFHHLMYKRFNIGNEKTKISYNKIMAELKEHYQTFNDKLPKDYKSTFAALYLAFVAFIDREKRRKMGKDGRITSINFTHDNLSKRDAFSEMCKIISSKLKTK